MFNPDKGGHHQGWDKPPRDSKTGKLASSSKPETWSTFDDSVDAMNRQALDGIGFNLLGLDGIVVHDLDDCRNPETGAINPQAMNIVRLVGGYWEISPSGTGIRGICWGRKTGSRVEASKGGPVNGAQYDGSAGRYITLTGQLLRESTADICDAHPGGIEAAYALMFPAQESQPAPKSRPKHVDVDDLTLIKRAQQAANGAKFSGLWNGDFSGYQSQSEADQALCAHLAFWTGGDAARIDSLFRRSGLIRDKWDERRRNLTYGHITIAKALQGQGDYYSPNGHHADGSFGRSHELNSGYMADEGWPAMEPLPETPSAPNLPEDMVPKRLRPWLMDVARQAAIPLAMVVAPTLVTASSIVGRAVGIRPSKFSDWTVVPNLWGAVIARPGSLKSEAINQGTSPVKRLAATARDRFQTEEYLNVADIAALEAELEGIKTKMKASAKGKATETMEYLKQLLAHKLQELETTKTTERRYWMADATPEKTIDLLQENPRGLLVCYDELAGLLAEMNKPGREGSRAFYLAAWDGKTPHYVDRIGRGTTYLPAACLSVVGGIQPDRLRQYLTEATSGGGGGDGLLQRFQILVWIDGLGEWKPPDSWPDTTAKNEAFEVFRALDEINAASLGAKDDPDTIPFLRFTADAQALYDVWRTKLENRLRGNEFIAAPAFEAHMSKYRSLMPSLALLFHLIDLAPFDAGHGQVSLEATQLAADWCDFLEAHARVVYAAEVDPGLDAAHRLAEKIREGLIPHKEPVRGVYRHHWAGLSSREDVAQGLELLAECGWLRVVSQPTAGAPISVLHFHPDLRGAKND